MEIINSTVLGFLASVPVWGLLLFFIFRNLKNRDNFEKLMTVEMDSIKILLNKFDKDLALIQKDIEHAANLSKSVSELTERVGKINYDVNNYFEKFRTLEKRLTNGS